VRADAACRRRGAGGRLVTRVPPRLAGGAHPLALAASLPTACQWREMAEQGCLLGYGPSYAEAYRRTADLVARIFRGAQPGDLPIEGPTHFEFMVNLRTAKALALTVPPAIL